MRPFPIHVDSPMAIDATRIYGHYPGRAPGRASVGIGGRSLLYGKWVHLHRTRAESEALNPMKGPAVIISSSGMLSGGRILHHCRVRLPHAENTLLITGYQAEETLGRAPPRRRARRAHPQGRGAGAGRGGEPQGHVGPRRRGRDDALALGRRRSRRTVFVTHGEERRRGGAGRAHHPRAWLRDPRARARRRGGALSDPGADQGRLSALVCDIDGVILHDQAALPGAAELLLWLEARELPFVFLTNFPSQTPDDLQGPIPPGGARGRGRSLLHLGHGHRGVPAGPGGHRTPGLRGGRGRPRARARGGRVHHLARWRSTSWSSARPWPTTSR